MVKIKNPAAGRLQPTHMPESIFPDVISAKDLQERISALNQEAKSIDFYDLEEDAQDAALEGLQAQTQSLLRRAFGVLDGVIARYATYHRTFHAAADQSQTSANTCYDAEQCEKANNLVELTKIAKNILRGKGELATGAAAGQEDRFHRLILVSDLLRCRLLRVLERRELTVTELCECLDLPQSTVSRHLKLLLDGFLPISFIASMQRRRP